MSENFHSSLVTLLLRLVFDAQAELHRVRNSAQPRRALLSVTPSVAAAQAMQTKAGVGQMKPNPGLRLFEEMPSS